MNESLEMKSTAKWTFMVYMAGDNNLSAAGDMDMEEMRGVGSNADVNIIVEFDNVGSLGTRRYHVQSHVQSVDGDDCVQAMGETDSGDPNVLIRFVEWAVEHYPAQRYALVLWNHGCGWEPMELDKIARSVRSCDYNEREAAERSASPLGRLFFRTSLEKIFSLPFSSERAICSDDGTGHSLDTIELGRVLSHVAGILGRPLDLLGMDACLMSNLEVVYQAQTYVRYIVASEENEPAGGWPYGDVLRKLVAEPDMETADFAGHIVDLYAHHYQGYGSAITQAALDTSRLMDVVKPLDDLAGLLSKDMETMQNTVWRAQRNTASFWHFTLWDLAHFCKELEKETAERIESELTKCAVLQATTKLLSALQSGANQFVIAEAHRGPKVAQCGGITIYLPSAPSISRYYDELDYAKRHRWSTMIRRYLEV
jgi:hypothetical protein